MGREHSGFDNSATLQNILGHFIYFKLHSSSRQFIQKIKTKTLCTFTAPLLLAPGRVCALTLAPRDPQQCVFDAQRRSQRFG